MLFSGQAAVPEVVADDSAWVVLLILAAKALAYAISLACGFRGGPVFPGGVPGRRRGDHRRGPPRHLAGARGGGPTAAGMAAMTRLLFASLLFSALLVDSAGVDTIPAAVFAATAARLVSAALDREVIAAAAEPPPLS